MNSWIVGVTASWRMGKSQSISSPKKEAREIKQKEIKPACLEKSIHFTDKLRS